MTFGFYKLDKDGKATGNDVKRENK